MRSENKEPLGRLIYHTAQEIKNFAEKILKPYDLTLEQFHVLKQMSSTVGMNQREIGQLVNKTPANMTRILDRLESKNLIVRQSDKKDRRSSHVLLTPQGSTLLKKVMATFESFSSHIKEGVDEKDQQTTRKVLDIIGRNIKTMAETFQP